MGTYKVVVVDDSAVSRKIVADAISQDPSIEVAYSAPNPKLAYMFLENNEADLVILDVDMPEINGIDAAATIKKRWPSIIIMMCSSSTARGAETTLLALEKGATDYISKPTARTGRQQFSSDILSKVRALLTGKRGMTKKPFGQSSAPSAALTPSASAPANPTLLARSFDGPLEAVAIGCSTGGPAALDELYSNLNTPFPVPTFIVQHMPAAFTRMLAERLGTKTGFEIKEGEHGEEVRNGVTYIAPGGKHMIVIQEKGRRFIQLNEGPMEHSCRPAVDVLFRTLAGVYRDRVVSAILTGMGADGSGGTVALSKAGSEVLVQDPSTCVVPSMPSASLQMNSVDRILKLDEIAQRFTHRCAVAFGERKKAQ